MLICRQEIIRLLSPLAQQVIPPSVPNALRQLFTDLPTHIAVMFSTCSHFLRQAKLASATIFSRLVDRLLRVTKAAHEAAQFLGNPPERQQMVQDWQAFVNSQMIVDRELPCHSPLLKDILESEISNLLQPGYYGATIEDILEKWTVFLTNLPERFGEISPKHFHIFLSAVASAALRDLTRNGAITGWSWWLLSCWIDEWLRWQAESAEFLRKSMAIINNDHVPLLREEHINH
jgi:regulatory factor X